MDMLLLAVFARVALGALTIFAKAAPKASSTCFINSPKEMDIFLPRMMDSIFCLICLDDCKITNTETQDVKESRSWLTLLLPCV